MTFGDKRDLLGGVAVAPVERAAERVHVLESILELSDDAVLIATAGTPGSIPTILYVNRAYTRMTGYDAVEVVGTVPHVLQCLHSDASGLDVHPTAASFGGNPAALRAALEAGQAFSGEMREVRKDGSIYPLEWRMAPVKDAAGNLLNWVSIQRDLTRRRQAEDALRVIEERLAHDAFHDRLTGLPNRAFFMELLERASGHSRRRANYLFAVLLLDVDRFEMVNDSLGHESGDQLLVAIARRLESCLRPGDSVARFGGDEFAILLDDVKDLNDAAGVSARINRELALPFRVDDQDVFVSASLGIALNSLGYERPEDLLRDADTALHRAQAKGTGRHEVFEAGMRTRAVELLKLETDLRRALERRELRVWYQPIVALSSGRLTGFEALVRWQHPERGLLCPEDFLAVAEETGLIVPIDRWVLREACGLTLLWQRRHPASLPLSITVNLSTKQFLHRDLLDHVARTLRDTSLEAGSLRLEITESTIMARPEAAASTLARLRALGVRLSIDDFGTGYSSLSYLQSFPVDTLKIDRSFVSRMGTEREGTIARAIVELGLNLGLEVVAEGVETDDQLSRLGELECGHGQGHYFSRPLSPDAAGALIARCPRWRGLGELAFGSG